MWLLMCREAQIRAHEATATVLEGAPHAAWAPRLRRGLRTGHPGVWPSGVGGTAPAEGAFRPSAPFQTGACAAGSSGPFPRCFLSCWVPFARWRVRRPRGSRVARAHTHAHTHVHMCAHTHMCAPVHTHVHAHEHAHMHIHTHTCTCVHVCTRTHAYTYMRTHACMHPHTCTYTHVCTCSHTCAHAHTYTHAHTCTR